MNKPFYTLILLPSNLLDNVIYICNFSSLKSNKTKEKIPWDVTKLSLLLTEPWRTRSKKLYAIAWGCPNPGEFVLRKYMSLTEVSRTLTNMISKIIWFWAVTEAARTLANSFFKMIYYYSVNETDRTLIVNSSFKIICTSMF